MPSGPAALHRCRVPGCERLIVTELLMCRTHWYMVPMELRRRVWAGYRRGMDDQYRVDVGAAVDAVLLKQAG